MDATFRLDAGFAPSGDGVRAAMRAGLEFLDGHAPAELLARVGARIESVPEFQAVDKTALQDSFGGNQSGPPDDFLVGRGLFYLSEQRRLFLDCTAGHYQMLWGYNHPALCAAVVQAMQAGITWDNHSNIPQWPLKLLAHRLVALANGPDEARPLDTVLLGVCTGSVACGAALKIQLKVFEKTRGPDAVPVVIVLRGNYHGTDMVPQFMRGLWPELLRRFEVATLEANDGQALERAFRRYGSRVAGFWAEPVLMNCEAIALAPDYLRLARQLCDETGALMCLDEIQTGFWRPEVFEFKALEVRPDLVVVGKGMTAGFHPLSGVLFHHRHDVLDQYDAISTNGSAALPAYVALCSLAMIERDVGRIREVGRRIEQSFHTLAKEFSERLESAQGHGHLAGLKFRRVDDALAFHRRALEAGLWTRVHAYHQGHSTVLTKLGLLADQTVVDFVTDKFRALLRELD